MSSREDLESQKKDIKEIPSKWFHGKPTKRSISKVIHEMINGRNAFFRKSGRQKYNIQCISYSGWLKTCYYCMNLAFIILLIFFLLHVILLSLCTQEYYLFIQTHPFGLFQEYVTDQIIEYFINFSLGLLLISYVYECAFLSFIGFVFLIFVSLSFVLAPIYSICCLIVCQIFYGFHSLYLTHRMGSLSFYSFM